MLQNVREYGKKKYFMNVGPPGYHIPGSRADETNLGHVLGGVLSFFYKKKGMKHQKASTKHTQSEPPPNIHTTNGKKVLKIVKSAERKCSN